MRDTRNKYWKEKIQNFMFFSVKKPTAMKVGMQRIKKVVTIIDNQKLEWH